jgi:hypothetical protein
MTINKWTDASNMLTGGRLRYGWNYVLRESKTGMVVLATMIRPSYNAPNRDMFFRVFASKERMTNNIITMQKDRVGVWEFGPSHRSAPDLARMCGQYVATGHETPPAPRKPKSRWAQVMTPKVKEV